MIGHQPLELLAGILAALVEMMQQRIWLDSAPDRMITASVTSWAAYWYSSTSRRHGARRDPELAATAKDFSVRCKVISNENEFG